jgi:hypothetical protein
MVATSDSIVGAVVVAEHAARPSRERVDVHVDDGRGSSTGHSPETGHPSGEPAQPEIHQHR